MTWRLGGKRDDDPLRVLHFARGLAILPGWRNNPLTEIVGKRRWISKVHEHRGLWARRLLSFGATMRRLEARFYPVEEQGQTYVIVGHVTWLDAAARLQPRVEPAPSLARFPDPASLLSTLRHLVLKTFPRSFEALQGLRNPYWSFVTVDRTDGQVD